MDSLKQFYTILILFVITALFIVFAANNIYTSTTTQYIYIIIYVILFSIITICTIKFHKLYYSNRYFVYSAIGIVTLLFIVSIAINTYVEQFVGITLEPSNDGKTQIFSNDMDITYQDDLSEEQTFGNDITIYRKDNVCITDSNYFGTYNDKLECINPIDEEKRKKKEEEKKQQQIRDVEEEEKKEAELLEQYCKSKYISDKYPANEYCQDKYNNNKYGVKSVTAAPKCPGYQEVKCAYGYSNGGKISSDTLKNRTQCYPKNSDFNQICNSFMIRQKGLPPNTSVYGYENLNNTNCPKFETAAVCSSNYYNSVEKTPYYSSCVIDGASNDEIESTCPANSTIDTSIINTDGCNPGYKRYCCNRTKCLEQIAGHMISS